MNVQFFVGLIFLFFSLNLFSQTAFENQLNSFLNNPEYKHAAVGIHIAETESGKPVFELNPDKLFIPASVLKTVTSAAALEILGPDYRFHTRIGYSGKIVNGVLQGDIIIVGGGDPALGSEYFKEHYFAPHFLEVWVRKLKTAGIKSIQGNLVLNTFLYDEEQIPRTWIWEDIGNYYGAGASALTVYDNMFRISFRSPATSGMATEIISVYPRPEGLKFENKVLSSDINSDQAYVFGSPTDGTRVIRGTIPKNRKAFTIKASNPFPETLLADEFIHLLAHEGVFISGKTIFQNVSETEFKEIWVTESPALGEIVKVLNYESVNLFAEHLVKQIAAEETGIGNYKTGLMLISEYWKNKGLDTNQLFMEDGSGLSHFNAVSPAFLSSVLNKMAGSEKNTVVFKNSLPAAGQGTLAHFTTQSFLPQTFRAKSGSMTRVRCYTGYMQANSGQNFTFTIMVNHFGGSHYKLISEMEKLLLAIQQTF